QPGQTNQSNPESSSAASSAAEQETNRETRDSAQSCNSLTRLGVGDIAVVSDATPDPLPLRSGPSTSNAILVQIPIRTQVTIISGPFCDGRLVWWETQYRGSTGWAAEVNGYNAYNLIPNGQPLPGSGSNSSSSSSSSIGSLGTSSNNSCAGALSPTLEIGDRGRVTYTDGNGTGVRSEPQGTVLVTLDEGDQFVVIGGPRCTEGAARPNAHLWWVQVETDGGRVGWMPFGYVGGEYWIEPYESAGSNTIENVLVDFYYSPFQETYSLEVDSSNPFNCVILNGSEIVAQELNRSLVEFVTTLENEPITTFVNDMRYYLRNEGDIDTFRVMLDAYLVRNVGCQHSYYQVGDVTMDLYGLGNVAFGFYSTLATTEWTAYRIADYYQFREEGRLDYPDDRSQIALGRAISLANSPIYPWLVESVIPDNFVSSR
ncbi:SH3 domain-containing protein, partial [Candidatus Woesebacteria bacterium]|nr:SH3 domain-containing protein [Candidatus Woesebacteria bacterium]